MRVGQGFDAHRLVSGRKLILGGVVVPHDRGLEGHSDADVLCHAVGDALLGALGIGDLGTYFPSADAVWRDVAGGELLERILVQVSDAGLEIGNVDATLIAEEPRLEPYRGSICKGLAQSLRLAEARVNVKLKSTDGLGAMGRGEGIAALAVVVLTEKDAC